MNKEEIEIIRKEVRKEVLSYGIPGKSYSMSIILNIGLLANQEVRKRHIKDVLLHSNLGVVPTLSSFGNFDIFEDYKFNEEGKIAFYGFGIIPEQE